MLSFSDVSRTIISFSLTLWAKEMKTTLKAKNNGGLMYSFKTSHR